MNFLKKNKKYVIINLLNKYYCFSWWDMESKIDRVIKYIKTNISNGTWKQGDRILGEIDLAKSLQVSRNTVREALSLLSKDGFIVKKLGSGSYVSNKLVSNNGGKYIIISTVAELLRNITGYCYRTTIDFLNDLITEAGYIPYVYFGHEHLPITDFININLTDIAGIVNVLGNNDIYGDIIDANIPIVSCLNSSVSMYPSVTTDYLSLSNVFKGLIDNHQLKRYLIVSMETPIENCNHSEALIHYTMPKYLAGNNEIVYVPFDNDFKQASVLFKEKILSLDYIPEAIIFTDDAIFTSASKCFVELKDILSKTKLISESSQGRDFTIDFDVCKVEFDLKELAEKTFDLLLKHINCEYVPFHNIPIVPKVVNEEVLF